MNWKCVHRPILAFWFSYKWMSSICLSEPKFIQKTNQWELLPYLVCDFWQPGLLAALPYFLSFFLSLQRRKSVTAKHWLWILPVPIRTTEPAWCLVVIHYSCRSAANNHSRGKRKTEMNCSCDQLPSGTSLHASQPSVLLVPTGII